MSLSHLSDKELGKMLLDAARFSKSEAESGRLLRCWLVAEGAYQTELELLRAEVSRAAAVVQALSSAMPGDTDRVGPVGGSTATYSDLIREAGVLMEIRRRQIAIDPITNNTTPNKETT